MRALILCFILLQPGCSVFEQKAVDLSERAGIELGEYIAANLDESIGDALATSTDELARALEEKAPSGDPNTPWYATAALAALYAVRKGYVKAKQVPGEV